MKVLNMKMFRDKSLTIKVLLGLVVAGCFLPQQAGAQQLNQMQNFVNCLNFIGANASVAVAAASCIPAGCKYTNTMSQESAQPACTLRDGTRLPRVILNCGGFRPSFSLCTLGGVINHIELGEDQAQIIDEDHPMINGDSSKPSPNGLSLFGGNGTTPVVDTNSNKVCNDCHDHLGTTQAGIRLFRPIPPELKDGTLSTNDPNVPGPLNPVSLKTICTEIDSSNQLNNKPAGQLASKLCHNLVNAGDNF